jgi:hypothetical protein
MPARFNPKRFIVRLAAFVAAHALLIGAAISLVSLS